MVTMKQIADKAGVSRSTVSFVLNESPMMKNIPERTRKKVIAAAEQLGYIPNEIAQALITGKTKVLGFVSTQIDRQFVSKMLGGAMEAVDQNGYYLKVFPLSNAKSIETVFGNLLKRQVAAVILQGMDSATVEWFQKKLFENHIPFCLLGSSFSSPCSIRVVSDDSQGAENAISYLAEKGHRKILFLNGQSDWPAFMIRQDGAEAGSEKHEVRLFTVAIESFRPGVPEYGDIERIRVQIETILKKQLGHVTAVFCPNDALAVLAVQACIRLGVKVPSELSVMGYSLSMLSLYCDPELTSIIQPHYRMGFTAAVELMDALRKESGQSFDHSVTIKLPTSINKGATVASV